MLTVFLIRKHITITQEKFTALFYDFFVHSQDPTRSDQFGITSQEIHTWLVVSLVTCERWIQSDSLDKYPNAMLTVKWLLMIIFSL